MTDRNLNLFGVVADPVRLAIVRRLSSRGSATLGELAEEAGVHANTVRHHVAELEASSIVEREQATPDGPGRPHVRYHLSSGWRLPTTDLRGLSELLCALVVRLGPTPGDIDGLGREWGRFLAGRPAGGPLDELPRLLERLGFDAEVVGSEVRLRSCPCPSISPAHPELICRLAQAVVDGVLETGTERLRVAAADHHPERRRCTIRLGGRVPEASLRVCLRPAG
ncbi:MAG TPA: helix-turn-helix domain-containing protein [Solirubrobacteraceae bacterium]|nr:helix-turn-helix domain-containing protein [Solirubrobacteraceae bacterium]